MIFPLEEAERVAAAARQHGVATFLDGARLWNAAIASGQPFARLAAPFDLVAVALSKCLGAPGGSLLAGSRDIVAQAVRSRRMFGGAMRQVGIYAAAGLYALDHNVERLVEDHENARLIAKRLAASPCIIIDSRTSRRISCFSSWRIEHPMHRRLLSGRRSVGSWFLRSGRDGSEP